LEALLKHMVGLRRNPRDLLGALVNNVIDTEGRPLFSFDSILQACSQVSSQASPAPSRQSTPRKLVRKDSKVLDSDSLRDSKESASASRPLLARRNTIDDRMDSVSASRPSLARRGSAESLSTPTTSTCTNGFAEDLRAANATQLGSTALNLIGEQADRAIIKRTMQALRLMVSNTGLSFDDVVGQLLWRHRNAEPLQQSHHKNVVENPKWIVAGQDVGDEFIEGCKTVFRVLAKAEGGRMKLGQWKKVMEIIQANPVLNLRVRRSDAVRLYYGETRSISENSLGLKDFMCLLLKTAETIEVHPMMVFFSVSAHASRLQQDANEAEA